MVPSTTLSILLVYISSLISVFPLQVFGSTSPIKTNPLQDQPLIQTLEDIEALSYFLLSIFSNDRCKSSSGDRHNTRDDARCSKNLTEANFLRFFDDLRPGADKMTRGSIDCDQETVEYLDLIGSSSGSNSSELKSQSNGEALRNKLKQICHEASRCQSSEEMLDLIRKKGSSNGDSEERSDLRVSNSIVKLCPVMMFQLHDSKCSQDFVADDINQARPSSGSVWGFAILFVTIISFCSLVGVMIMPFIDKNSFQNMMNLFEGLAVGSLVGSAIFHLIPQAFDLVIKYPSHDFLWKALIIFGGIYLFFWSERIMKIAADFKRKRKLAQVNLPSSNSDPTNLANGFNAMKHVYFRDMGDDEKSQTPGNDAQSSHHLMETSLSNANNNPTSDKKGSSTSSLNKHFHSHFIDPSASGGEQTIATVAWMIILGDGLHNFIDGLSVGAAFSNSILTGISTSVAVICEEFPHELGDFAVLLSSGMTLRQAIGYNFLSACTCYLGMILGIIIGDSAAGSTYIFALAGGMFLYIALVDMMAELSAALDEALAQSSGKMIQALILQNIGILLGISTLFLLAKYSNRINFEGLAPFDQSELPIVSSVG